MKLYFVYYKSNRKILGPMSFKEASLLWRASDGWSVILKMVVDEEGKRY